VERHVKLSLRLRQERGRLAVDVADVCPPFTLIRAALHCAVRIDKVETRRRRPCEKSDPKRETPPDAALVTGLIETALPRSDNVLSIRGINRKVE
jgi:hypothetical protein